MTVIEHDVYECPDCGAIGWHTRTCGMFPGEMVDAGNRIKVVRAIEHRGTVDLLREVAASGVESDYMGVGYVVVQVDRPTWDALAPYRTGGQ